MTTAHHTPYPFGGPLTSAAMEAPLGQLDAAIATVIATGSGTSTTLTAQALAGQASLTVASSAGFAVGDPIYIGTGATFESRIVATVPNATTITVTVNLTNTYAIGKPVSKSPVEIVDARGTYGTLGGRVKAIEDRVYDARRYGAKGDGTTDDTSAINAAISAANLAGGGTVYFSAGTYVISATLVLSAGVSLAGVERSSTLFLKAASNCVMVRLADAIEDGFYSTTRQAISDLRLDGNRANQGAGAWHGIEIATGAASRNTTMLIENVWVQFTKGDGFYVGLNRLGNTLLRCSAWGCDGSGFSILSSDNQIVACSSGLCAKGLYINDWVNTVVGGFYFQATGPAVHLDTSARYNVLHGLAIDNTAQQGILIAGNDNVVESVMIRGASSSLDNGYAYIEITTPKTGNIVRGCIFNSHASVAALGSAGLKVGASSTGIFGPNVMEGGVYKEASGTVPVRYQTRPRLQLTRTALQSIPNITATIITWDSETLDALGLHDLVTNPSRVTIPADKGLSGWWDIGTLIEFASNATGQRQVRIMRNGVIVARDVRGAVSGDATGVEISRSIYLNDSDYLEVAVYQSSGAALDVTLQTWSPILTMTRRED